jgi:hypothetical protein
MNAVTAIHTRRSIRAYDKRPVAREIIEDILWDAAQAPTTPVSGPLLFHVIEGAAQIAELGERAKQYVRELCPGSTGYAWADKPDFKVFLDAPVVIVVSATLTTPSRFRIATARDRTSCFRPSPAGWAAAGSALPCCGCAVVRRERSSASATPSHPTRPLRLAMPPRSRQRGRVNDRRSCGPDVEVGPAA